MTAMSVVIAALLALVAVATAPAAVNAQANPPACISKLLPCVTYLNSTKPPSSCCTPLKDAVQHELPCLCSLLNNPDLIKSTGIDIKQALQLPKHCGITASTSICSKSSTPGAHAPAPAPAPTPGSTSPPATPGSDSNVLTTMGLSGIASLIMLWWSLWA